MADSTFMNVAGPAGQINGSVRFQGYENWIEILGFEQSSGIDSCTETTPMPPRRSSTACSSRSMRSQSAPGAGAGAARRGTSRNVYADGDQRGAGA